MKGWIRESETLDYTKDKIKSVQSDVALKPGADVYETDNFSNIESTSELPREITLNQNFT